MNNLQLKAHVMGLGLTAQECADLFAANKRTINYWLAGTRKPEDVENVDLIFFTMASHYTMVLDKMTTDIERSTVRNFDDDTKPSAIKPILPFFYDFESFQMATECPHVVYWKIYQSVISHLILIGKITKLDDNAVIPADFWIWKWFGGEYEPT